MSVPNAILLATLISDAAKLRENSYDTAAADAASLLGMAGFDQFYRVDLHNACRAVCVTANCEVYTDLIFILLQNNWNDALNWANNVKKL